MAGAHVTAKLGPEERAAALAALADTEHDVLVVGGGVVGSGVALDAATRGLSVGLVEARDFGSGTSSRSSKLIHGGLRYLEQFNFGLVREALTERALLLQRIAPHLIKPVSFLFPFTHYGWERAYIGAGVSMYDLLGVARGQVRGLPVHRQLTRSRALRLASVPSTWSQAQSYSSGPSRWSMPPAYGPMRSRRWSAGAVRSMYARPRASTWWCPGTASSRTP